jgi:hypothetical protein
MSLRTRLQKSKNAKPQVRGTLALSTKYFRRIAPKNDLYEIVTEIRVKSMNQVRPFIFVDIFVERGVYKNLTAQHPRPVRTWPGVLWGETVSSFGLFGS